MKTVIISNISLAFDSEGTKSAKLQALEYIDFLNRVFDEMGLPDRPQILLEEGNIEIKEIDWVKEGLL